MALTHKKEWALTPSGARRPFEKTYTGELEIALQRTVANGQTDFNIAVGIDVSAVQSFFLVSSQAVTIETNNGSTPDDTIVLKAGVPYEWNTDSYDTFKLDTDVTSLKVTNASGASADVELYALIDATP
jgi:hypothetical protein